MARHAARRTGGSPRRGGAHPHRPIGRPSPSRAERRRARARRRRRVLSAGIVVVVAIGSAVFFGFRTPTQPHEVSALPTSLPTTSSSTSSTTTTTSSPAQVWAGQFAEVSAWVASRQGTVEVSIADLPTGTVLDVTAAQEPIRSASIVKVAIAIAAIRTRRGHGANLSSGDQQLLAKMIRTSDNKAATALWDLSGQNAGLEHVIADAGMTSTTPNRGGAWGFAMTTAHDQASLLDRLTSGALLNADDSKYVLELMREVTPEQRWGLAEAAPAGNHVAVKNGWYVDTDTPVWRVHCLAVFDDGSAPRPIAVAVMTRYPSRLGIQYGKETCQGVGQRLLAPPPPPPLPTVGNIPAE